MPRAGLSPDAVVDVALDLVDEGGAGALTLAAVAGRAGVATPSLYKHVRNLTELRALVSIRIMDEISDRAGEAVLGRSGDDALRALMKAYRSYVVDHPGRYSAMMQEADPGVVESGRRRIEAGQRLVDIMLAALRAYGLEGGEAIHAARSLRSAAHGFAVLEAAGGFGLPEKLDESYELLIHMVISGLRTPR
ncbi:TetR/AcrR family transcriptional regulator [Actinomadura alba]|uniref:WHG domain-containing protein n=1 Tax=Actinomadura alba TaxID=406431 RepID=A0ABR7LVD8_9ACTN|nr:TetR-like C-terminal domain-containing protein [Actinomadura alba]MBC6468539.1 WHG domain-containing protein [Actinomadura alba]